MALKLDTAYPTAFDYAKKMYAGKRQRRAVTGRGETYDEAAATTEGAIKAALQARLAHEPFKAEQRRLEEARRQFNISMGLKEEQAEAQGAAMSGAAVGAGAGAMFGPLIVAGASTGGAALVGAGIGAIAMPLLKDLPVVGDILDFLF